MSDYISEIWHADMKQNGLLPLIKDLSDHEGNPEDGYVIVDMDPFPNRNANPNPDRQVNVLKEVVIPERKMESYRLFEALHDNFEFRKSQKESDPEGTEWKEVNELFNFAIKTKPMEIAKEFAIEKGFISRNASNQEWIDKLHSFWFATYEDNSTSLFEHVFIGEQGGQRPPQEGEGYKLGGHHFWYHYYINDGPFEVTQMDDTIAFLKHVEVIRSEKSNKAEVITIKYTYTKKDEEDELELLKTPKGGFFVGLSVEGLLAIGTVAFLVDSDDAGVNINFDLNGEEYSLTVWRTMDRHKHPRTFFPVIKSAVPVR